MGTREGRASRQRGNPRVTRINTRALRRKRSIACAGTDDDPVTVIAILCRQSEAAGESCSRLQLDRIPAVRVIQYGLQGRARSHIDRVAWGWSIGHGALNGRARQLCRAVEIARP